MKKFVLLSFLGWVMSTQAFTDEEKTVEQLTPQQRFADTLQKATQQMAQITDYTALLHKYERVELLGLVSYTRASKNMVLKHKLSPRSIYILINKYDETTDALERQTEAVYCQDKNNNKLIYRKNHIIHGNLVKGSIEKISPDSFLVKKLSGHSINEAGIDSVLTLIKDNYQRVLEDGLDKKPETIIYQGQEPMGKRTVDIFKITLPPKSRKGVKYYGHKIMLYFDKEHHLPIKIRVDNWSNKLVAEYHFENVVFDVGLTDDDFILK